MDYTKQEIIQSVDYLQGALDNWAGTLVVGIHREIDKLLGALETADSDHAAMRIVLGTVPTFEDIARHAEKRLGFADILGIAVENIWENIDDDRRNPGLPPLIITP